MGEHKFKIYMEIEVVVSDCSYDEALGLIEDGFYEVQNEEIIDIEHIESYENYEDFD